MTGTSFVTRDTDRGVLAFRRGLAAALSDAHEALAAPTAGARANQLHTTVLHRVESLLARHGQPIGPFRFEVYESMAAGVRSVALDEAGTAARTIRRALPEIAQGADSGMQALEGALKLLRKARWHA